MRTPDTISGLKLLESLRGKMHFVREINMFHYTDTDEIPGFFLLLKNHIFIARSEDTIFIFHL